MIIENIVILSLIKLHFLLLMYHEKTDIPLPFVNNSLLSIDRYVTEDKRRTPGHRGSSFIGYLSSRVFFLWKKADQMTIFKNISPPPSGSLGSILLYP